MRTLLSAWDIAFNGETCFCNQAIKLCKKIFCEKYISVKKCMCTYTVATFCHGSIT